MNGIIPQFNDILTEPAVNTTVAEKAAFKEWTNHQRVAKQCTLQYMEARMKAEYTVIHYVKILLHKLTSVNLLVFYFNNFQIREYICSIKLWDS